MSEEDAARRLFAETLPLVQEPPTKDCQAVGYMMRDWLQAVIADAGTHVDTGGGMGQFDLWVKVGGKEIYISLKEKA